MNTTEEELSLETLNIDDDSNETKSEHGTIVEVLDEENLQSYIGWCLGF